MDLTIPGAAVSPLKPVESELKIGVDLQMCDDLAIATREMEDFAAGFAAASQQS